MNKKHLDYAEDWFIVLGFLFFSGALGELGIFPASLISLCRWFIAFGSLFLIATRFNFLTWKCSRDPFLVAVIALAFISFIWSDFSSDTFSKVRSELLPMTSFGLYLGASFDIKTLIKKLSNAVIVGLLLSWVTAIAIPSIGKAQGNFSGAWTGVYGHKNSSSTYMILTALTLLLASFQKSSQRWMGVYRHNWFRCLGISAFIFIFLTTSGTGLVLSILITFNLLLYSRFRWRGKITVLLLDLAILVLGSVAIIVLGNWHTILTSMDKDPTLTGRTTFWEVSIQALLNHSPLLGFGRGGFWAPGSPYLQEIARAFGATGAYGGGYVPPHAHNGFIELALDVGLVGLSLFFISFLFIWFRSLKQGYGVKEPENLFPLGFMILFSVNNITESYTLYLYNMFWPLYIAIALNVGQLKLRRKSVETKLQSSPMVLRS